MGKTTKKSRTKSERKNAARRSGRTRAGYRGTNLAKESDTTGPAEDDRLAALIAFDPKVMMPVKRSPFDSCMLALALAYNDIKGVLLAEQAIRASFSGNDDDITPEMGQVGGTLIQSRRYCCALLHELFKLARTHREMLEGRDFETMLKPLKAKQRRVWSEFLAMAIDKTSNFSKALERIRHAGAFHYHQPKTLADAFDEYFNVGRGSDSGDPRRAHAFVSLGRNWEQSRYYYADGAARQVIETIAARCEVKDFDARLERALDIANHGLASALTAYLHARMHAIVPWPPLETDDSAPNL
jgi:hypothetical protein